MLGSCIGRGHFHDERGGDFWGPRGVLRRPEMTGLETTPSYSTEAYNPKQVKVSTPRGGSLIDIARMPRIALGDAVIERADSRGSCGPWRKTASAGRVQTLQPRVWER